MTFEDLLQFVREEDERLRAQFPDATAESRVFGRALKIAEEVGELCEAVLGLAGLQRRDKPAATVAGAADEIADVLLSVLVFAESLELDVLAALARRMSALERRHEARRNRHEHIQS